MSALPPERTLIEGIEKSALCQNIQTALDMIV
jgi:hypothetical protein